MPPNETINGCSASHEDNDQQPTNSRNSIFFFFLLLRFCLRFRVRVDRGKRVCVSRAFRVSFYRRFVVVDTIQRFALFEMPFRAVNVSFCLVFRSNTLRVVYIGQGHDYVNRTLYKSLNRRNTCSAFTVNDDFPFRHTNPNQMTMKNCKRCLEIDATQRVPLSLYPFIQLI